MSRKDINFEKDAVHQVRDALRRGDKAAATRIMDRLILEGDPEVVQRIARELGI